jgi:hypothetical protein
VFVALVIQHAVRTRRIIIFGMFASKVLFHFVSKMAKYSGKKLLNTKGVF